MVRNTALIYVALSALIVEAIVWGVLLPWAHYRYSTGVSFGVGMWKPIVLLALAGGLAGLIAFVVRHSVRGR